MTPIQANQPAAEGRQFDDRFGDPASSAAVERAAAALAANGITVVRAADTAEARRFVLELVPDGQVHHASSQSLEESGIVEEIEGSGRYDAIRRQLWGMDRETQAAEIRRLGSAPDVMLGSVQAVTETGSLVTASATGSQLGAYAFGAGRLILVVGTQKIVSDLDEAFRRIEQYALPLEDARAHASYGVHSAVNSVLIINRAWFPGRITVVLVDEALGF